MLGNWLNGVEKQTKARIHRGVCAVVWALWNYRNDMIFDKVRTAHFFTAIRMVIFWIREWSYLLAEA
jgi:hypothetical protein